MKKQSLPFMVVPAVFLLALAVYVWNTRDSSKGPRELGTPQADSRAATGSRDKVRVAWTERMAERLTFEAGGVDPALMIHVQDTAGRPIKGVAVFIEAVESSESSEGLFLPCFTDGEGRAGFNVEGTDAWWILTVKKGFAATRDLCDLSRTKSVRIEICAEASIRGIVVDANGLPVAGVQILATSSWDLTPTLEHYFAALTGGMGMPKVATTAQEGTFEILGVDPRKKYTLTAAGSGWAAPSIYNVGSDSEVRLEACPLAAIAIKFYPEDLPPIEEAGGLANTLTMSRSLDCAKHLDNADLIMAMHDREDLGTAESRMVVTACVQPNCNPRVNFSLNITGFRAVVKTIPLKPLSEGVAEHVLKLEPLEPVSDIACTFVGPGDLLHAVQARGMSVLVAKLTPTGSFAKYTYRLGAFESAATGVVAKIRSVPHGTYDLAIEHADGLFMQVPLASTQVTVGQDGAQLPIDLSAYGYLDVTIEAGQGQGLRYGLNQLSILPAKGGVQPSARSVTDEGRMFMVRSWPQVIGPLAPGEYWIAVHVETGDRVETRLQRAVVHAGTTQPVRL